MRSTSLLLLASCSTVPAPEPEDIRPSSALTLPPQEPRCEQVRTPFADPDRRALSALTDRIRSGFGDYRASYVKGHKHAGLDLVTTPGERVFPICAGAVVDIHLGSPHRTIVVSHLTPEDERFFSSYKHVEDLRVRVGQTVTADTDLARVFNTQEQSEAAWGLNHLHFELRRSIDDNGAASWTSMSMDALRRYARDPAPFFAERLEQ